DGAEPLVGGWLQHRGDPTRGWGAVLLGHLAEPCGRCGADVGEHGDRGDQRSTTAPHRALISPEVDRPLLHIKPLCLEGCCFRVYGGWRYFGTAPPLSKSGELHEQGCRYQQA